MRTQLAGSVVALGLAIAGCGETAQTPSTGTITVSAAASLTAAFQSVGADFVKAHPHVLVSFNFAGSTTLVAQIQQGAPVDVFASADQTNMQALVDSGLVAGSPQVFATNRLAIVIQAGNPKGITGLRDLARPGLVVALCGSTVPCGRYAAQALARAGVTVTPASLELDVKSVVTKVALGEADAGLVYVTDVRAGGAKVARVDIPDNQNVIATYPIAVLKAAHDNQAARAFVEFVQSPEAQRILASFGFAGP